MPKPNYLEYMKMNYVYTCNGKEHMVKDTDECIVEHNKYFCVICHKCCNVPVLHLLERKSS